MNFEDNLWGKVIDLHERYKRQNDNINNIIYLLTQFQNVLYYYGRDLKKAANKNLTLFEENNTTQSFLLQAFLNNLKIQGENFSRKYNEIKEIITEPSKKIFKDLNNKEEKDFNNFIKTQKSYEKLLDKMKSSEKNYQQYVQIAEENTKKYVESQLNNKNEEDILYNEEVSENSLIDANNYETQYLNNVNKANELRNDYNKYQNIYLQNYYSLNFQVGTTINNIVISYISLMKDLLGNILTDIDILSDKIRKLDITQDIYEYINQNKSNLKPEENINFQYYKPKTKLDLDSLNPMLDYKIIQLMKSRLKTVFLNFNESEEKEKIEFRIIYSKLFNDGIILDEKEIEKIKSSLLKKEYRNFFILYLNNQRKNGRYIRKKEIIKILAIMLNEILDINEKEIDMNSVKNTILLSQTFYYENEDKEKIYIDESLKNHHWVKTIEFWKNLIEYMISEELNRQYAFNTKKFEEKKEEEKSNVVSIVCFTQLISYVNIMQQFGIDKNQINDLIQLFVKKYSIDNNYLEQIYKIIK